MTDIVYGSVRGACINTVNVLYMDRKNVGLFGRKSGQLDYYYGPYSTFMVTIPFSPSLLDFFCSSQKEMPQSSPPPPPLVFALWKNFTIFPHLQVGCVRRGEVMPYLPCHVVLLLTLLALVQRSCSGVAVHCDETLLDTGVVGYADSAYGRIAWDSATTNTTTHTDNTAPHPTRSCWVLRCGGRVHLRWKQLRFSRVPASIPCTYGLQLHSLSGTTPYLCTAPLLGSLSRWYIEELSPPQDGNVVLSYSQGGRGAFLLEWECVEGVGDGQCSSYGVDTAAAVGSVVWGVGGVGCVRVRSASAVTVVIPEVLCLAPELASLHISTVEGLFTFCKDYPTALLWDAKIVDFFIEMDTARNTNRPPNITDMTRDLYELIHKRHELRTEGSFVVRTELETQRNTTAEGTRFFAVLHEFFPEAVQIRWEEVVPTALHSGPPAEGLSCDVCTQGDTEVCLHTLLGCDASSTLPGGVCDVDVEGISEGPNSTACSFVCPLWVNRSLLSLEGVAGNLKLFLHGCDDVVALLEAYVRARLQPPLISFDNSSCPAEETVLPDAQCGACPPLSLSGVLSPVEVYPLYRQDVFTVEDGVCVLRCNPALIGSYGEVVCGVGDGGVFDCRVYDVNTTDGVQCTSVRFSCEPKVKQMGTVVTVQPTPSEYVWVREGLCANDCSDDPALSLIEGLERAECFGHGEFEHSSMCRLVPQVGYTCFEAGSVQARCNKLTNQVNFFVHSGDSIRTTAVEELRIANGFGVCWRTFVVVTQGSCEAHGADPIHSLQNCADAVQELTLSGWDLPNDPFMTTPQAGSPPHCSISSYGVSFLKTTQKVFAICSAQHSCICIRTERPAYQHNTLHLSIHNTCKGYISGIHNCIAAAASFTNTLLWTADPSEGRVCTVDATQRVVSLQEGCSVDAPCVCTGLAPLRVSVEVCPPFALLRGEGEGEMLEGDVAQLLHGFLLSKGGAHGGYSIVKGGEVDMGVVCGVVDAVVASRALTTAQRCIVYTEPGEQREYSVPLGSPLLTALFFTAAVSAVLFLCSVVLDLPKEACVSVVVKSFGIFFAVFFVSEANFFGYSGGGGLASQALLGPNGTVGVMQADSIELIQKYLTNFPPIAVSTSCAFARWALPKLGQTTATTITTPQRTPYGYIEIPDPTLRSAFERFLENDTFAKSLRRGHIVKTPLGRRLAQGETKLSNTVVWYMLGACVVGVCLLCVMQCVVGVWIRRVKVGIGEPHADLRQAALVCAQLLAVEGEKERERERGAIGGGGLTALLHTIRAAGASLRLGTLLRSFVVCYHTEEF